MNNINTIRQALAAQFTGLHTYATEPTAPESPCAIVGFPEVEFDRTFGGTAEFKFTVRIGTSTADENQADEFLGDAISNLTINPINAAWKGLHVESSSRPRNVQIANATYRVVEVQITVQA